MKTNSEVDPAEMNGSGKPVGGMLPLNISYCIINFYKKKESVYNSLSASCFAFLSSSISFNLSSLECRDIFKFLSIS